MKLLVISDTLDPDKTIVPYSLRLARSMDIHVKVLHIVDRRIVHGVYSAYADSRTVSPHVETFEETLKKELSIAEIFLSKLISREASVLNFPVRVEFEVAEDTIEDRLIAESKEPANEIILISSQPDGHFWQDHRDITYVANRLHCPVMLVPRKTEYRHPGKVKINWMNNWADKRQLNKVLCFIGELGIEPETIKQIGPVKKFDPEIRSDEELLVIVQGRPVFLKRLLTTRLSTVLLNTGHIPILLVNFKAKKQPKAEKALIP